MERVEDSGLVGGLDGGMDDLGLDYRQQGREYEMQRLRMENLALQEERQRLRQLLQVVALAEGRRIEKRSNVINADGYTVEDRGQVCKRPVGRTASMATQEALRKVSPIQQVDLIAPNIIQACKNPLGSVEYLSSPQFASDLVTLCHRANAMFERETRCLFLQSPVYVFGDLHGNLEDLRFFSDNIWTLGLPVTAGKFLFLGDYVDRGMHSVEVIAYMLALKVQCPSKVFLLRGNHELRDVNGWEEHYREKSFLWQCKARFGPELGEHIWEEVNQVFDRLPLAAVIDNDIFCVHGGIPRPRPGTNGNRLEDILLVPSIAGISPKYAHETDEVARIASECLWSDPAKPSQEHALAADGYGDSPRGAGAVCFGTKAVDQFLSRHGFSCIVRAHEAHSEGVALSKAARVITVFSTSKDHNQGRTAMAGCILIDNDEIQIINRSPKYKNRVVRRRCSVQTLNIPQHWAEQGSRLGLIVDTASSNDLLKQQRSWGPQKTSPSNQQQQPAPAVPSGGLRLFGGIFGNRHVTENANNTHVNNHSRSKSHDSAHTHAHNNHANANNNGQGSGSQVQAPRPPSPIGGTKYPVLPEFPTTGMDGLNSQDDSNRGQFVDQFVYDDGYSDSDDEGNRANNMSRGVANRVNRNTQAAPRIPNNNDGGNSSANSSPTTHARNDSSGIGYGGSKCAPAGQEFDAQAYTAAVYHVDLGGLSKVQPVSIVPGPVAMEM